MKVQILGAHNIESRDTRCISLIIDDIMVIDAGALTSSLSFEAQQKLKAVLLTHQHYDHIRDIPVLGMNFYLCEDAIDVYSTLPVREALLEYMLNDILYPNFMEKPPQKPAIRFNTVEVHEHPVDYCISKVMGTVNYLGGLDHTTGVPTRYDPDDPLGPWQLGLFDQES